MVRAIAKSSVSACALILSTTLAGVSYAEEGRSVALVLDASGSMNAKLPDGVTRIDAAKAAVADLIGKLPADTRLGLRAYGHQSPTQARNCQDTALLVGFDAAARNRSAAIAAARGIHAQGYTPITHVLKLAAEDLGKESSASRVVVLVSDGKETCAGDPCATAKALADADAKLVIHTVGLAVDGAARYQLQCIANVARGIYVGAGSTAELSAALGRATQAAPARKTTEIVITNASGKIRIEGAPPAYHEVINAATGQEVAKINTGYPQEVELPAGIYNVKFQNGLWMGVEVKAKATTKLTPGFLRIEGRDLWGNNLLDPETGEVVGKLGAAYDRVALLPTRINVSFANVDSTLWPETVEIKEGQTTTLRPGAIQIRSSKTFKATVKRADGQLAGEIISGIPRIALPPGQYTLQLGDQQVPIELAAGQNVEIKVD